MCPYAWLLCIRNKKPQLQSSWGKRERFISHCSGLLMRAIWSNPYMRTECAQNFQMNGTCEVPFGRNPCCSLLQMGSMLEEYMLSWFKIFVSAWCEFWALNLMQGLPSLGRAWLRCGLMFHLWWQRWDKALSSSQLLLHFLFGIHLVGSQQGNGSCAVQQLSEAMWPKTSPQMGMMVQQESGNL